MVALYRSRLLTALAAACTLVLTSASVAQAGAVGTTPRGRKHPECKIDPMRNNSPQKLPRYGKACAHLYVNGVRRVSQCHHVTK